MNSGDTGIKTEFFYKTLGLIILEQQMRTIKSLFAITVVVALSSCAGTTKPTEGQSKLRSLVKEEEPTNPTKRNENRRVFLGTVD